MTSLYENQVKNPNRTKGALRCKCGSVRLEANVCKDDNDEFNWCSVDCKACGRGRKHLEGLS